MNICTHIYIARTYLNHIFSGMLEMLETNEIRIRLVIVGKISLRFNIGKRGDCLENSRRQWISSGEGFLQSSTLKIPESGNRSLE